MPRAISEFEKLAREATKVLGDDAVERNPGGRDWLYRITFPNGYRVQLHGTPSDPHYMENTLKDMDRNGSWSRLKREYEERKAEEKREKVVIDAEANERKFDEVARISDAYHADLAKFAGPYAPQPVDMNWLFNPHSIPETRRVLIPPDVAEKILLELNKSNRPIRKGRVAYWSNIIRRGRWRFTHQGIAFDTNATLQDGQHRLAAAVEQEYILDVLVSVGMPPENFGAIDVGASRSGSDAFATAGLVSENYNVHSGAVRLVLLFDRYGPEIRLGYKTRVPNDELVEAGIQFGSRMVNVVSKAERIRRAKDSPKMSSIALAAGIFLIGRHLREEDPRLIEFLRGFAEGTDLPRGDSRIKLRSFMANLIDRHNKRVGTVDQLAIFIKAWNAWANNRSVESLAFRRDELMPRPFVPPPLGD